MKASRPKLYPLRPAGTTAAQRRRKTDPPAPPPTPAKPRHLTFVIPEGYRVVGFDRFCGE